jgi:aspartyl-tRNA(Asn)/glutamyl-tRNA(Gln) amidotransferase subunit C
VIKRGVHSLDKEEIHAISKLCKIRLSDAEAESLRNDLEQILNYVDQLASVDTEGVEPCYQVITPDETPLLDDTPSEPLDLKEYLKNAPDKIGSMIKTPPVIKEA